MQSPRFPSPTPPRTNQNWPEGYGFRIGGNAPVIITDIFENSYAQKSGLRPGDQLLEVDGVNVQGLSKDDVITLARQSKRVPPALCVISRIRTFTLRRRRGTFGFKVRGGGPVFVSQLEERGPAKVAGIRLGDMLVEVNNTSVREMTFTEVDRLILTSGSVLQLVMIAGVKSIEEIEKRNTASRFRRAREFFQEVLHSHFMQRLTVFHVLMQSKYHLPIDELLFSRRGKEAIPTGEVVKQICKR